MQKALETWGRRGVPDNPGAWIHTAAKNALLDELKHARIAKAHASGEAREEPVTTSEARFAGELEDDTLRMLFVCCDPSLARRSQLALALKILCGFATREIASALMQEEEAVRKRITRSREALRTVASEAKPPLEESLEAVHQVLYLIFNKGYSARRGATPLEASLCREAIRLTEALAQHSIGSTPASWALLALMQLHYARIESRYDHKGALLLLDEQDRGLWDRALIGVAMRNLASSASGEFLTRFHVEAGIQLEHCMAPSYEATNWQEIVRLYELHEARNTSPTHRVNRAIALAEWKGPEAGLALLEAMTPPAWLSRWYLWDATLGELYRRAGNRKRAEYHLARALEGAPSDAEKERITQRLRRTTAG